MLVATLAYGGVPMRVAVLLLLSSLAGCASWSGATAARRDFLAEALEAERLPLSTAQAARLLQSAPGLATGCRRAPDGALSCEVCGAEGCASLTEEGEDTRVRNAGSLREPELSAAWLRVAPGTHREVLAAIPRLMPSLLIEQERRFEPRWGLTAGVLASASGDGSAVALGLRAGVRRWFDARLAGQAALEYRWRGDHELHARFGLELSRWTPYRFWGGVGAPPWSVILFAGPLLRVPLMRAGVRTGVGVLVTDLRSAPMFLELSADTLFAEDASRVIGTLSFGFGI